MFGKLKSERFPSIEASKETRIREDDEEEEKNNHALKVAIASAAAAEAAITAAQAAVEVIRLQSAHQHKGKSDKEQEIQHVKNRLDVSQSTFQCQRKIEEFSAIKIQTAFRGYLVSFVSSYVFSAIFTLLLMCVLTYEVSTQTLDMILTRTLDTGFNLKIEVSVLVSARHVSNCGHVFNLRCRWW